MQNHPPELLAPAGDWECLKAAIENGADAVYFGLDRFNARMRAKNFTSADLPAIMEFLHRRGAKGYLTFNTLVFSNELEEAEDYLRTVIACGVDAVIVQDVGIARLIRRLSPDLPIHCSTQMTITSPAGLDFARSLDAQLVVLARENNFADIARMQAAQREAGAPAPLPLEVFVHGALCVAYSGQCLTSEALGGRSANRGECAQACRLPYELWSDGQKIELGDRKYLLSPRDLAGIDVIDQLIHAGVASLKIEGRLKSAEYVASITRVYRQALDKAWKRLNAAGSGGIQNAEFRIQEDGKRQPAPNPAPPPSQGENRESKIESPHYELEMSFSRGLSTGWFGGTDNQSLVHARFGTKRGVFLGEVSRIARDTVWLRLKAAIKPGDGVVFDAGTPEAGEEGGRVYEIEQSGPETGLRFGRNDVDFRRIRAGNLLWKTNDPALDRELRGTYEGDKIRHQRPVHAEAHGHAGAPLTLILRDEAGHIARTESAMPLETATKQPLDEARLREQLGRLGNTPFRLGSLVSHLEGAVTLPVSELNRLRRDLSAELDRQRALPRRWTLSEAAPLPAAPAPLSATEPELIALVRHLPQIDAAWESGIRTLYCDFENPKRYRDAVTRFRELQAATGSKDASIWVAPPRVFKPGEEWILEQVRSSEPDGFLARNHDHLRCYAGARLRGDFSLNVANQLAAEYYISEYKLERVTASYDLNVAQFEALLAAGPADRLDITLHQHMPLFHMEHCVFCAFMSDGKDYRDCGRPCEKHRVELRDRIGAMLPLKADAGCRNTVFNNRAQTGAEFLPRFLALGARHFRIEFVDESAEEVRSTLQSYQRLLKGELSGAELWRDFKLINQLGVTRGQLEAAHRQLPRKQ